MLIASSISANWTYIAQNVDFLRQDHAKKSKHRQLPDDALTEIAKMPARLAMMALGDISFVVAVSFFSLSLSLATKPKSFYFSRARMKSVSVAIGSPDGLDSRTYTFSATRRMSLALCGLLCVVALR